MTAAGCAALLVAAYANSFQNAFQFDDQSVVVNNVYLRSLANVPRFFADARTYSSFPANTTYRPLVSTTLAVDYAIGGGLSPAAFRADQLLLMLALGALLIPLFRRVMDEAAPGGGNRWLALFAATLFCVHVVHTETMNLMHVRSELLSTAGLVAAFVVYGDGRRASRRWLSLAPMALGAFAKIPAVLFAPLLFTWEYLRARDTGAPPRDRLRTALRAAAPATVAGGALYVLVERVMHAALQSYGGADAYRYALTQAWAWVHYLRLFFLPFGLSADTDLRLIERWHDPRVLLGLLVIALLAVTAWRSARRREHRPIAFGLAWYMIALLPASSVLPISEPINEHRPFVAYIGLVLAVVWAARLALDAAARRWTGARRARAVAPLACALVLLAHAVGVHARNRVWRTDETLWADVTTKSPHNGRAWMNYGVALMARARWQPAKEAFERALLLVPTYHLVPVNLGVLAAATGDDASAERHFRRAIQLGPATPDVYDFYARFLIRKGRGAEAAPLLERALAVAPADVAAATMLRELRGAPSTAPAAGPARPWSEGADRVPARAPAAR